MAALYKSLKQKKENADSGAVNRKRKTGVLEAKPIPAPAAKKAKASEAGNSDKTRKPLTRSASLPSTSFGSPSKTSPKSKSRPPRAKAPPKKHLRKPSLPSVVEDEEEDEVARLLWSPSQRVRSVTMLNLHTASLAPEDQAAINGRCYDLTVAPLADVSEAYEEPSPPSPAKSKPQAGASQVISP
jgi:hypothetical protein